MRLPARARSGLLSLVLLLRPVVPWLPLFCFVVSLGWFGYLSVDILNCPVGLKYGEGVVLDQSRRVFHEPGLYPPFDESPYLIGNYPPVYPTLIALLPASVNSPFYVGRLVSILSVVAAAFLIVFIVSREVNDWAGYLGGAAFLLLPELIEFGSLMRIDSLGLCLGLLGFALTLASATPGATASSRSRLLRIAGAIAFFLSIYTRHSLLGMPVTAYGILLAREGKRTLLWPVGLLGAGAFAFLIGSYWSGGELYNHLIHLNKLPYTWGAVAAKWVLAMFPSRYLLLLAAMLSLWPARIEDSERSGWARIGFVILFLVAASAWVGGILVQYRGEAGQHIAWRLWPYLEVSHAAIGIAVALALFGWTGKTAHDAGPRRSAWLILCGSATAFAIGRAGSDSNYLFEYYALLSIAAACAFAAPGRLRRALAMVVLAGYGIFTSINYYPIRSYSKEYIDYRVDEFEVLRGWISGIVRDESAPSILSEDPAIPVTLGLPLEYQPFMYAQLRRIGEWDPAKLVRDLDAQRFAVVVRTKDQFYSSYVWSDTNQRDVPRFEAAPTYNNNTRFPKAVEDAIKRNYRLAARPGFESIDSQQAAKLGYLCKMATHVSINPYVLKWHYVFERIPR